MMLSHVARRLSRLPLVVAAVVVVACSGATEVPAEPAAAEEQPTAEPSPPPTEQEPGSSDPVAVAAIEGTSIEDSRDPFLPVRAASTAAEPPSDPATPVVPTSPTGEPAEPIQAAPPEDCVFDGAACVEHLTLLEVGDDADGPAVFQISTTLYEVWVGESFAGGLQLIALYGTCATVGYAGDSFEICAVAAESGLK